jgi:glycosyl transferase family 25
MVNINYYIIHCDEHEEREQYLKTIRTLLGKPIETIKGIYSKFVKLSDQLEFMKTFNSIFHFDKKSNFKFYLSGQIGCYLSHFKILEKILNNKNNNLYVDDYSVVFEDDVTFQDNLHSQIENIVSTLEKSNIDFDIIYLGNNNDNKGTHVVSNIYNLDPNKNCWGTHALLLKNKNIENLYYSVLSIRDEIDSHYKKCICNNILDGFVIYPSICSTQKEFVSNIKEYPQVEEFPPTNTTNIQMKRIIQMKQIMQLKQRIKMKLL